jgi:hypothetical protein
VKQEVWAAKRITVCCGTSQLTWSVYLHGANTVVAPTEQVANEINDPRRDVGKYRPNIPLGEVICLRNLRKRGEPSQLPETLDIDELHPHEILRLLNESTDCQTTNTHDRIYALLGMAGIGQADEQTQQTDEVLTMDVDYNIPLEVLYRRVAMSMMSHVGAYAILATDGTFGARYGFDFTSWTPDFRHPTRCQLLTTFRLAPATTHAINYQVEDEQSLRRFREINSDPSQPNLCLQGYHIATIIGPAQQKLSPYCDLYPVIPSRPHGGGKHSPIEDYPFLKPMEAELAKWIHNIRETEEVRIVDYVDIYGAFAVPSEVEPGDIVTLVGTVGVPVLLRPMMEKRTTFKFVGCAYLFSDIREIKLTAEWKLELRRELTTTLAGIQGIEEKRRVFEVV